MIATGPRGRNAVRLLVADRGGGVREVGPMRALVDHLRAGDVLVVNDAATLPAAFSARLDDGVTFEARLLEAPDPNGRARAVLFGAGSARERTEDRVAPPQVEVGDAVVLGGSLHARVVDLLGHPRLVQLELVERGAQLWSRLYAAGTAIRYSYVEHALALYDVQTAYAGIPLAAELPSAGYGLTWEILGALRRKKVQIARVTHAAGISSTGVAALDARLPLAELSRVGTEAAERVNLARADGQRIFAVGTSVTRALETFATPDGRLESGERAATLRIDRRYRLRLVDGILTGMHAPGESHHDLLEAFAPLDALTSLAALAEDRGFASHEFGDALLLVPALRPLRVGWA